MSNVQQNELAINHGIDPFSQPSFSLSNRVLRACWSLVWLCLFRFSPKPCHRWRVFLLRCFGGRIAGDCHIYPSAQIWAPWNLEMASEACLADKVNCYCMGKIRLGKRVIISQESYLCGGTHQYNDPHFQLVARDITVEDFAWVAARAFVGPGVTIHKGAVAGACAVVTKDLDAWTVYAGNPCKAVNSRREMNG